MSPHTRNAFTLPHDEIARRVADEHAIELELDRLEDLFEEPAIDPFEDRPRSLHAGIEELGTMLAALRQLPDDLTVRITLPAGALAALSETEVEAAIHRRAELLAADSWRKAMAVRNMGRRQTPLGVVIGLIGGFTAYGAAYLAGQVDSDWAAAGLLVIAAIAIAVGWIVGWVTIESAILDWRLDAHTADAYQLLADARVELLPRDP